MDLTPSAVVFCSFRAPAPLDRPAATYSIRKYMHAPHFDTHQRQNAQTIATNVRRLMARDGLTFTDVVEMTGLDERTIRGLVRGANNPHARTLHKFAHGLGVSIDELFQPASLARPAGIRSGHQSAGGKCGPVAIAIVRRLVDRRLRRALQPIRPRRPAERSGRRRRGRSDQRQALAPAASLRDSRNERIGTPGRLRQAACIDALPSLTHPAKRMDQILRTVQRFRRSAIS